MPAAAENADDSLEEPFDSADLPQRGNGIVVSPPLKTRKDQYNGHSFKAWSDQGVGGPQYRLPNIMVP